MMRICYPQLENFLNYFLHDANFRELSCLYAKFLEVIET